MQTLLIAIRSYMRSGTEVAKFLALHSFPPELKLFALKYRTLDDVWRNAPRADWLLRMLDSIHLVPAPKMRLLSCYCARQISRHLKDSRAVDVIRLTELANEGAITWHDVEPARSAAYQALAEVQGKGDKLTEELNWTAYSIAKEDAYTSAYDCCVHSMEALKLLYGPKDAKGYLKRQADALRELMGRPFEAFQM